MKALSLTAPYGSLIAIGAKLIETRSWATHYRGPLAIHQAKGLGPVGGQAGIEALCDSEPFFRTFVTHGLAKRHSNPDEIVQRLPRGAIVAYCHLVDCIPTDSITEAKKLFHKNANGHPQFWKLDTKERAFGDYESGRYAWLLVDVRALPEPLPARGAQGLWNWEPPEGFVCPA